MRILFLLLLAPIAIADNGHGHNHNDGDVTVDANTTLNSSLSAGDLVAGDTNVSHESSSLALGNVLGDVDIADCLGSTQWNTPIYGRQGLVLNHVCMAEFYLRAGKYDLAAMALCNVPEILKEFSTEDECETAHDFSPVVSTSLVQEIEEEHDQDIDRLQMTQMETMMRLEQIEERIERAPRSRVVQKPTFSEEQKEAAWRALKGDEEE